MTDAALGSLGSDLAFAVSFAVAGEVLAAASEGNVADEDLFAGLLALTIVASALTRASHVVWELAATRGKKSKIVVDGGEEDLAKDDDNGLKQFLSLLLTMVQRILLSTAVQLLANTARAREPLRSVRIISLVSVSVFFVFVSGTSHVGR